MNKRFKKDHVKYAVTMSLDRKDREMLLAAAKAMRGADADCIEGIEDDPGPIECEYGTIDKDLLFRWDRIIHQLEGKFLNHSKFDVRNMTVKCPKCKEDKILLGNHLRWCGKVTLTGKHRKFKHKKMKPHEYAPDPEILQRIARGV